MKILNEIKNPRWKKFFKCEPNNIDCIHCKYTEQEKSIPKTDFQHISIDEDGNKKQITIKEITLVYGKHEDVVGWKF